MSSPEVSKLSLAIGHAAMFRTMLLEKNGVPIDQRRSDKRSLYELVTHGHQLETRHNAVLQSACQVIDDLLAALKE